MAQVLQVTTAALLLMIIWVTNSLTMRVGTINNKHFMNRLAGSSLQRRIIVIERNELFKMYSTSTNNKHHNDDDTSDSNYNNSNISDGNKMNSRKFTAKVRTSSIMKPISSNSERPPDPFELMKSSDSNSSGNDLIELSASLLYDWWSDKQQVLCITGAGLSTESGLADYRGHKGSYFNGHKPMIHQHFMEKEISRKRYWGRAMVGWRDFAAAPPSEGHRALAVLEKIGKLGVSFDDTKQDYKLDALHSNIIGKGRMSIITQNVDGIHHKAGSKYVTELHGRHDRLVCQHCGHVHCRHVFQDLLDEINVDLGIKADASKATPDGDGELVKSNYEDVIVPPCHRCGPVGFYKPDVVFFGDNVMKPRVERCYAAVEACDGLLVVGSSLAVHSAYRFVQHAAVKNKKPIAILNVGETRADSLYGDDVNILKIESPAGPVLKCLVEMFSDDSKESCREEREQVKHAI